MAFSATAVFAGDAIDGIWKTKPDDNSNFGYAEVTPCELVFYGMLAKAFDGSGTEAISDNIGKQIIWDIVANLDGLYDTEKLWSPDRNKTYSSDMTFKGDQFAVRGCVLGNCRDGGTRIRVK